MRDDNPPFRGVLVDAGEPGRDPGEELDVLAAFGEEGLVHPDALFPGDLVHRVEIGEDFLAAGLLGEFPGARPKLRGGHAHAGDEPEVLHVGRGEGGIKIVEDGADGLAVRHRKNPFLRAHPL